MGVSPQADWLPTDAQRLALLGSMLDGDGDGAPAGAPAQAALSASVLAAARAVLSHSTGGAAPKSDDRAALVELLSFVKRMLPAGSATTAAAAAGGGATRASLSLSEITRIFDVVHTHSQLARALAEIRRARVGFSSPLYP